MVLLPRPARGKRDGRTLGAGGTCASLTTGVSFVQPFLDICQRECLGGDCGGETAITSRGRLNKGPPDRQS